VSDAPPEVIDDLNRLMAEEVEAFLRYFQMRFRLRGNGRQAVESFFGEALKETLEHAEALAAQIRALGHVPTLRIDLTLGDDPVRPDEALAEAIEVEQQALAAYKEFLPRVDSDPVRGPFIRRQVDVESEHVEEIREALRSGVALRLVDKPAGK
jgi:bacterioferritin (cytochrome b1)